MTAITILTFGTSQIDLFASKVINRQNKIKPCICVFLHIFHQIAAISDPEADGSIGNVVAANAIGVFLGLGFPWLVASIYWGQV